MTASTRAYASWAGKFSRMRRARPGLPEPEVTDDTPRRNFRPSSPPRHRRFQLPRRALPDARTPDQVPADASDLKAHLDAGKGLGFLFFRSEVVRRTRYLAKDVRVDGRPCSSRPTLGILIEALGVRRTVDHLWSTWSGRADRRDGPLALQVSELHEHLEALEAVLAIGEKLASAKDACRGVIGMGEPPWHDAAALEGLLRSCESVEAERKLEEVRFKFGQQVQRLAELAASPDSHPLRGQAVGGR